ncbi:MAG TPA: hypothetical protein VFX02_02875 [Gammaproteobacteria bacterium]|nr:hypothetical protein [Gammaproteobacteria bacterium]
MSPEQKPSRILQLTEQLEQLVRDMNRARPGSYTMDVLRFYACEIEEIAKALREAVKTEN